MPDADITIHKMDAENDLVNGVPYWVHDTPLEQEYRLIMFGSKGDAEEEIMLTRTEYIALKTDLARLRGYVSAEKHCAA